VIRLALRVRRADAEIVLAELLGLAPAGVEERDVDADVVEYAVYGAPGELPALPDLRAAAGGALVDVVTTEVADDWADRWREFHAPVTVGGRVHVRAPWHPRVSAEVAPVEVVIDPGQAFGTGAHATTRLCLELLLALEPSGPLVDLGCGSGVLAIAAARLGFGPVFAIDTDPAAIEATTRNAAANGIPLEARLSDARFDRLSAADIVLANLDLPTLGSLTRKLDCRVVVTSGYDVAHRLALPGFRPVARRTQENWAADLHEGE
jgi:ribosomal protein L11 methyltransferase